jgi:hypothetical protein
MKNKDSGILLIVVRMISIFQVGYQFKGFIILYYKKK